MTTEERTESYIDSLLPSLPDYLDKMAVEARKDHIPIIRPAMMSYMRTMLALYKPMTILEVGCAIGFSALFMREYAPKGCKITTIERDEERIAEARRNLSEFDKTGQIKLLEGDALQILKGLEGQYDMIFMDAAKAQYINMYDDVKRLLVPGGLLLSDNILQEGDILESRYAVTRRDRTIHARMREYLYRLTHDSDLETSILPVADGVAVSVLVSGADGETDGREDIGK